MQKIEYKLIILASVLFGVFSFSPVLVSALDCTNPQTVHDQVQCGANGAAGNTGTSDANKTLSDTITSVIDILSVAVGVIAVIMIIIGGLRYVTSAGSPEAAKGAKNTVLYAIIGLIIVAFAQVIVHFVLNRASNPASATNTSTSSSSGNSGGLTGSSTTPNNSGGLSGSNVPQ